MWYQKCISNSNKKCSFNKTNAKCWAMIICVTVSFMLGSYIEKNNIEWRRRRRFLFYLILKFKSIFMILFSIILPSRISMISKIKISFFYMYKTVIYYHLFYRDGVWIEYSEFVCENWKVTGFRPDKNTYRYIPM